MSASKRRLLITGVTGLLGHTLARESSERYDVFGLARSVAPADRLCHALNADICNADEVARTVQAIEPQLVIHTAAMTSVDDCERLPERAHCVNVQGTRHILRALKGSGCSFVHISTDAVFDGHQGNYREEDKTNPIHVYGKTKLAAEQEVAEHRPDAVIVRTCIYGWNLVPKLSLAEWVIRSLQQGKSILGYADLFFSPIPTVLLSRLLLKLAKMNVRGILHLTGREGCSKFDFARKCALEFHLGPENVLPAQSASLERGVRRPANVTLCVDKAAELLGFPLPSIDDGLRAFHASERFLS